MDTRPQSAFKKKYIYLLWCLKREARAQKRNKTKSVITFKSRGHTGVIISFTYIHDVKCNPTHLNTFMIIQFLKSTSQRNGLKYFSKKTMFGLLSPVV